MTKNGERVTLREVYSLINETKAEIKKDISEIRTTFHAFEEGRLTKLEIDYAKFKTRVYTVGGAILFIIGILQFVVNFVYK